MSRSTAFTFNQLIVLGLLKHRELYGLEIVNAAAAKTSPNQASIGTIYPLLKDLVHYGWLSCRKDPKSHRTFYRLTELGQMHLSQMTAQWESIHDSLDELLGAPAVMMPPQQRTPPPAPNR
jgi:PadR family transcriptional regulator, regulatory protein PadR